MSQGSIFYGIHMYPGLAQYDEPEKESFRILVNERTIRNMGKTFAGRPVFVDHVEGVDENLDELKKEADGWVVESFFNEADGKNWVKFIITSNRGLEAIKRGYRLSNAYVPSSFGTGGVWNGIEYQKEVMDGEFEHLAVVQNPRYDESVIMTPEEFKSYNAKQKFELEKLKNSKGETKMKFFTKKKVENSIDLEGTMVELPKSKQELSLGAIMNAYDTILNLNGYAAPEHMVKVNDKEEMSVSDLTKAYQAKCNEMEEIMKKKNEEVDGGEPGEDDGMENEALDIDQMGDVGDRGGDKSLDNEEEDEEEIKKKDKKQLEEKKKNAADKARALKNAHLRAFEPTMPTIELLGDQIARGKSRYGSVKK